MRFGTWNVRSLYGASSPTPTVRKLARYKSDLVGVQEVRCDIHTSTIDPEPPRGYRGKIQVMGRNLNRIPETA
jgi:exonuclease III